MSFLNLEFETGKQFMYLVNNDANYDPLALAQWDEDDIEINEVDVGEIIIALEQLSKLA
ncbi:hypothetical protein [Nostoc favosum]|uniref:Uncharacterized protein n=1 Tax=Nostoc favosum CHAB5714 TaxID=2780399 RepID=A0ABS8IL26_9NOSO|nr:hypothetical protein [Nostoc favosum]MCC5604902.1 hypothetical protein [Nostoc favosum CHAB5714]